MNTVLLFAIVAVITFAAVVLVDKFFGRKGLLALAPVLLIAANVGSSKIAALGIGDLTATVGTPFFAAMFLLTDILNEKYSKRDAKLAIMLAITGQILFLAAMGASMLYEPAVFDTAHDSIVCLFSINWRVTTASILMFAVSNYLDVWLFDLMKRKGTPLWVRNNVATIVTNCLENFLFLGIAFIGTMPLESILTSSIVISVLEMGLAILDTPFLYLSRKMISIEKEEEET